LHAGRQVLQDQVRRAEPQPSHTQRLQRPPDRSRPPAQAISPGAATGSLGNSELVCSVTSARDPARARPLTSASARQLPTRPGLPPNAIFLSCPCWRALAVTGWFSGPAGCSCSARCPSLSPPPQSRGPRNATSYSPPDPSSLFGSARKLAAWGGLTPTVRDGDRTVRHGHISKQGPACARWIVCEAAQTAKRHPDFAVGYQAIARRRGNKIAATTAIARKLLTRAYHLLADAASGGAPS
jgi:transposase IS116/IS110/IS902 family protein